MDFKINWKYPSNDNPNGSIFTQIVKLNSQGKVVYMPLQYVGMYIANLCSACKVDSNIVGYNDSMAFLKWGKIVGKTPYLQANNVEIKKEFILFDSITYLAFCIYKNICTMLEEIYGVTTNRASKSWGQCTKNILGENFLGEINRGTFHFQTNEVQSSIDNYIAEYNNFLMSFKGDFDKDFYENLCNCLRKYGDNDLIKPYLASINEKNRCFATFIEDKTNKKYISLSGFLDAKDLKILQWLGRNALNNFLNVAYQICVSMGAKYIPINLQTRRYFCDSCLPINVIQAQSLDDIINLDLEIQKKYYSCCERKIFGYFNDNTPNGKLYVKMKICGECILGLCFQMRGGNIIILYDGLEC